MSKSLLLPNIPLLSNFPVVILLFSPPIKVALFCNVCVVIFKSEMAEIVPLFSTLVDAIFIDPYEIMLVLESVLILSVLISKAVPAIKLLFSDIISVLVIISVLSALIEP